jgi:hypothetical protein
LPSLEELRSPWAIERWRKAMSVGYAKAPRCEHVRRNGQQCRCPAMRDARRLGLSSLCSSHCRGHARDKIDAARVPRLLREAQSIRRAEAEAALAAIARRMLHRAWLLDPSLPGTTAPHLNARDAARVERWLIERNLRDGVALQATGWPQTPRCWDRMTWAAILAIGGRIDEHGARRRLELAVKDEVAFWQRFEERGGGDGRRLAFQIRPSAKQVMREA